MVGVCVIRVRILSGRDATGVRHLNGWTFCRVMLEKILETNTVPTPEHTARAKSGKDRRLLNIRRFHKWQGLAKDPLPMSPTASSSRRERAV